MPQIALHALQRLTASLQWEEVTTRLQEIAYQAVPTLQGMGVWLCEEAAWVRVATHFRQTQAIYPSVRVALTDFSPEDTLVALTSPVAASAEWIQTVVVCPLKLEDSLIGFLDFYTDSDFDPADLAYFADVLPFAAAALHHAHIHRQEQEKLHFHELLQQMNMVLNRSLEIQDVIDRVLHNARKVVPYDTADVQIIEGTSLRVVGNYGFDDFFTMPPPENGSLVTWRDFPLMLEVYQTGKPALVADTQTDPRWKCTPEFAWIRSHLKAPILYDKQVIAFLNLDSATPNHFSEQHASMIQPFADQAAIAIHNAQIFNAEREQRRFSDALSETAHLLNSTFDLDVIINKVLDSITEVLHPETCSLMLVEDGYTRAVGSRGFEKYQLTDWIHNHVMEVDAVPNYRRALLTGQPIIVQDTLNDPHWLLIEADAWVRSHVDVSIQIEGQVIGFLNMDSHLPNAFSEREAAWLQAFANQAALAIHNARLFHAEHEQRNLNKALNESAALLNKSLLLDDVFQNILEIVGRVVPHDASNIMLIEEGYTRTIGQRGYEQYGNVDFTRHARYRVADVPDMQQAVLTGQVGIISDTHDFPKWKGHHEVSWIRSHLKAPILIENKVIGFLSLDSATPNFFTANHAVQIRGFAEQAALAIRNAQFFAQEHEQRVLNEALLETAALLNKSLILTDVVQNILQIVERVVPHDASNVMLIEDGYTRTIGQRGYEKFKSREFVKKIQFAVNDIIEMREAVQTREVRIVSDTLDSPGWGSHLAVGWIRSHLKAPIVIEGQVIGFIQLDSATPNFFTAKHAVQIRGFAEQAALAIRNAQFFTAEHEQRVLNEALNETAVLLNSSLSMDGVFKNILEILGRVVPSETANVMLIDGDYTRTIASRGYEQYGMTELVATLRFKIEDMPDFKRARDYGEIRLIKDTRQHEGWKDLAEAPWIRSHLKAPIQIDGKTIGFLSLDSSEANFYQEKHAGLLHLFAQQAALAIKNAQLFSAEQEQRRVNEALQVTATVLSSRLELHEVFDAILETVGEVVPYTTASIMAVEGSTTRTLIGRGFEKFGLEDWINQLSFQIDDSVKFQKDVQRNKTRVIPDTYADPEWIQLPELSWLRSHISAPIRIDKRLVGFINLDSDQPNFFQEKHGIWLDAFAQQAGLAIKNAELFTAEREQRRINEALQQTAQVLSSTLELHDVFDAILETVGEVVSHVTASIMVIENGKTRTLSSRGFEALGLKDWINHLQFDIENLPKFQHDVLMNQPRIIDDTAQHAEWVLVPEVEWIRSQLAAPIRVDDRLIGFLNLDSDQPNFFTPKHAEWLAAFAQQAGLAIKNAELFMAEREQRRLNEALRKTAALVSSTLDLNEVTERILEAVGQVVPHETSNIMVIEERTARTVASRGFENYGLRDWINTLQFRLEDYPTIQKNLESGKPRIFTDTYAAPDWMVFPETAWIRSNILMPIQFGGKLIGILNLDSSQPDFFREDQSLRVQAFVEQAAIAIRNAQLFAELNRERAHLAAILNGTNEGILYVEGSYIKYVNDSFLHVSGYQREDILDHRLGEFIDTSAEQIEKIRAQFYRALTKEGRFKEREFLMRRKNDDSLSVAVTATAISQSVPLRAVVVVRDISQEKQLQARQDRFITHAAHELRHPLSNFLTRLYLLRRKPDELEEHLSRLDDTAQRMTEILEDMMAVARFGQGQVSLNFSMVVLQQVIQEAMDSSQPLLKKFEAKIHTHWPPEDVTIRADRKFCLELVSILLTNAITSSYEQGQVEIVLESNPQFAILKIRDNGMPVPQEQLAQYFEPFHRPSAGNVIRTGLELTIAEYIVTQHRGTIGVEQDATGNVIVVKLPLSEAHD